MFTFIKYRLQLRRLERIDKKLSKQYKEADQRVTQKGQEDYMELAELSNHQD